MSTDKTEKARNKGSNKIHLILMLIYIIGITAGYIWIPALAFFIDLIIWLAVSFIPIDQQN